MPDKSRYRLSPKAIRHDAVEAARLALQLAEKAGDSEVALRASQTLAQLSRDLDRRPGERPGRWVKPKPAKPKTTYIIE